MGVACSSWSRLPCRQSTARNSNFGQTMCTFIGLLDDLVARCAERGVADRNHMRPAKANFTTGRRRFFPRSLWLICVFGLLACVAAITWIWWKSHEPHPALVFVAYTNSTPSHFRAVLLLKNPSNTELHYAAQSNGLPLYGVIEELSGQRMTNRALANIVWSPKPLPPRTEVSFVAEIPRDCLNCKTAVGIQKPSDIASRLTERLLLLILGEYSRSYESLSIALPLPSND